MLADFHVHSTFSDGKLSIPEVVDLFGSRGFGAIAITDHLCEERTLIGKAAHPVSTRKPEKQTYYLWDRRKELAGEFDAWEVASGPYLFSEVLQSVTEFTGAVPIASRRGASQTACLSPGSGSLAPCLRPLQ